MVIMILSYEPYILYSYGIVVMFPRDKNLAGVTFCVFVRLLVLEGTIVSQKCAHLLLLTQFLIKRQSLFS